MAKKKAAKDPPPKCHHFNFKTKKQYLNAGDIRELIKKGDPRYREWPQP